MHKEYLRFFEAFQEVVKYLPNLVVCAKRKQTSAPVQVVYIIYIILYKYIDLSHWIPSSVLRATRGYFSTTVTDITQKDIKTLITFSYNLWNGRHAKEIYIRYQIINISFEIDQTFLRNWFFKKVILFFLFYLLFTLIYFILIPSGWLVFNGGLIFTHIQLY